MIANVADQDELDYAGAVVENVPAVGVVGGWSDQNALEPSALEEDAVEWRARLGVCLSLTRGFQLDASEFQSC